MRSSFISRRRRNRQIYNVANFLCISSLAIGAIPSSFAVYAMAYVANGHTLTYGEAELVGYAAIVGIASMIAFMGFAIIAITHED